MLHEREVGENIPPCRFLRLGLGRNQELESGASGGSVTSGAVGNLSRGGLKKDCMLTYACSFLFKYCNNLIATLILIAIRCNACMSWGFCVFKMILNLFLCGFSVYSGLVWEILITLEHNFSKTYSMDLNRSLNTSSFSALSNTLHCPLHSTVQCTLYMTE